jgi:hypothetical protein
MQATSPIPHYDAEDFARRWARARLAAFRGNDPRAPAGDVQEQVLLEERFAGVGEDAGPRGEALLRAVFDNSRKLGAGLAVRLGVTFEVQDLQALLEAAGPPCLSGRWSERERARVLERPGCGFARAAGAHACDYWREALDGLVMGLGDRERVARHACARRGDGACIDVLFLDGSAEGSREGNAAGSTPAWAPLPENMAIDLQEAAEYFRHKTGIGVDLKGVNEGVLHFRFEGSTDGRCAPGAASTRYFSELVHARFPGLRLMDITPQAVLSEARSGL